MPAFSKQSEAKLATIHPDLQNILRTVIRDFDFAVLCGERGEAEQNKAYNTGKSKLRYPLSKHNHKPSLAVDIAPYPIDWYDTGRFHELAGRVLEVAALFDVPIVWGGNWETLKDYPHFELLR